MYNTYNKLVRDKVPEIIEENGKTPDVKVLDDDAFIQALDKKLTEEVKEYQRSKSIEEIANILEVLEAICQVRGYAVEDVIKHKSEKLNSRGGFNQRYFLVGFE